MATISSDTAKIAMRLEGLRKTYPGSAQAAVQNLSLDVHDGEIVTLLGPSGCGKTTTLRMAAGLEVPDAGDIFFWRQPGRVEFAAIVFASRQAQRRYGISILRHLAAHDGRRNVAFQ